MVYPESETDTTDTPLTPGPSTVCLAGDLCQVELDNVLAPSCRGLLKADSSPPTMVLGIAWSAIPRIFAAVKSSVIHRTSTTVALNAPSSELARAGAAFAVLNPFCVTAWNVRKRVVLGALSALQSSSHVPQFGCQCPLCSGGGLSSTVRMFSMLSGEARLVCIAQVLFSKSEVKLMAD